jgi:hypothetical protein
MTAGTEAEGNGDGSGNSNGCPANAGRYRRKYFWFDEGSARGFWTVRRDGGPFVSLGKKPPERHPEIQLRRRDCVRRQRLG